MHAAAAYTPDPDGTDLLLRHLGALGALDAGRPTAHERVVDAVGTDLADLLMTALGADRSPRVLRLRPAPASA